MNEEVVKQSYVLVEHPIEYVPVAITSVNLKCKIIKYIDPIQVLNIDLSRPVITFEIDIIRDMSYFNFQKTNNIFPQSAGFIS